MTRRRRRPTKSSIDPSVILDIDQVYKAINKVQMNHEPVTFIVREAECAVIENILRDLELKFDKTLKDVADIPCVEYAITPPPIQELTETFENIEEFPDEIKEDGQIFW